MSCQTGFYAVFYACAQRMAVWLVADFEALSCQITTNFDTSYAAQIPTAPAINYTACYQLGVLVCQWFEIIFQFSHSVFYFLKDLVFLVSAKSALENRQALLQFLICELACANCKCAWLCVLALYFCFFSYFINYKIQY